MGTPVELIEKMHGKVAEITCTLDEVGKLQEKYHIGKSDRERMVLHYALLEMSFRMRLLWLMKILTLKMFIYITLNRRGVW